jgi:phosphate/sulfate permease
LSFSLFERIIIAWLLTLPAAGVVGYLMVKLLQFCGALP